MSERPLLEPDLKLQLHKEAVNQKSQLPLKMIMVLDRIAPYLSMTSCSWKDFSTWKQR